MGCSCGLFEELYESAQMHHINISKFVEYLEITELPTFSSNFRIKFTSTWLVSFGKSIEGLHFDFQAVVVTAGRSIKASLIMLSGRACPLQPATPPKQFFVFREHPMSPLISKSATMKIDSTILCR